jgi:hypothetical protein|tara:strand:- start:2386 stop:2550 length:165 start_codon:yes stop_codon:yes gene_type:complete
MPRQMKLSGSKKTTKSLRRVKNYRKKTGHGCGTYNGNYDKHRGSQFTKTKLEVA